MGGESSKAEAVPPLHVDTRLLLWCGTAIDPATSSIPWATVLAALDGSSNNGGSGDGNSMAKRLLRSFFQSKRAAAAMPAGPRVQSSASDGDEGAANVDDVVAFIASVMGVPAPEPAALPSAPPQLPSHGKRPPSSARSLRGPSSGPSSSPLAPAAKAAAATAAVLHAAYADADGLLSREGAARMLADLYSVAPPPSPQHPTPLPQQPQEERAQQDQGQEHEQESVPTPAAAAAAAATAPAAAHPEAALDALWGGPAGPAGPSASASASTQAAPKRIDLSEFVARIQATLPRLPVMAAAWCERQLLGPLLEPLDGIVKAAAAAATAAAAEADAASAKAGGGGGGAASDVGRMSFTAAAALADAAAEASQALAQAKQTYGI